MFIFEGVHLIRVWFVLVEKVVMSEGRAIYAGSRFLS